MSMGRTAASLLWPGFGAFVCWLSPVSPARAVASEAVPWRRESPVWRHRIGRWRHPQEDYFESF